MVLPNSPASALATISELPPGAKGTISLSGFEGHVSACVLKGKLSAEVPAPTSNSRRVRFRIRALSRGPRHTE